MEKKVYQVKFVISAHGFDKKTRGIVVAENIDEAQIAAEQAVKKITELQCEHATYKLLKITEVECSFIISRRSRSIVDELMERISEGSFGVNSTM